MTAPLVLDGECTVYVAHELRQRLMQALEAAPTLSLDLADVAEFDGAGLQLLIAARREAEQRGGTLQLVAASPVVAETLKLVGLGAWLAPATSLEAAA